MSTATESRKAAVERAIDTIEWAMGDAGPASSVGIVGPHGFQRSIFVAHLRDLVAAARAGVESEAEPEEEAPACIYCGSECSVDACGSTYNIDCSNPDCLATGPNSPSPKAAVEAFLRPAHLPGASKPEPPPSEVSIVRGSIRITVDRNGMAGIAACIPECESPAFWKFATADQLDALAALASRVAAEVRAKGGAA